MKSNRDPVLPRIALKALAINAVLACLGTIGLQATQQPIPAILPLSGIIALETLKTVARSDRDRPD
jgi:hypothetical protein